MCTEFRTSIFQIGSLTPNSCATRCSDRIDTHCCSRALDLPLISVQIHKMDKIKVGQHAKGIAGTSTGSMHLFHGIHYCFFGSHCYNKRKRSLDASYPLQCQRSIVIPRRSLCFARPNSSNARAPAIDVSITSSGSLLAFKNYIPLSRVKFFHTIH